MGNGGQPGSPPGVSADDIVMDTSATKTPHTAVFDGQDLPHYQSYFSFKTGGETTYVWAHYRTGATGDYHSFCYTDLSGSYGSTVDVEADLPGKGTNSDTVNLSTAGFSESAPSPSASDNGDGTWKVEASPGTGADGLYLVVMPLSDDPGDPWSAYEAAGGWAEVKSGSADVTVTAVSGASYAAFLVSGEPGGTATPTIKSPATSLTL